MGNGPVKYLGITNYQGQMNGNAPGGGGGRMNRGAAGMRSAGFQAMINNTLRNTAASRRKFSEVSACYFDSWLDWMVQNW